MMFWLRGTSAGADQHADGGVGEPVQKGDARNDHGGAGVVPARQYTLPLAGPAPHACPGNSLGYCCSCCSEIKDHRMGALERFICSFSRHRQKERETAVTIQREREPDMHSFHVSQAVFVDPAQASSSF